MGKIISGYVKKIAFIMVGKLVASKGAVVDTELHTASYRHITSSPE